MVECPRCHTPYDEKPGFCGVCGTKIPGEEPMVQPPADPLIGMILDARYRIIDLIGRGGMGAVYRVEHVKMGKVMAVKILHGELSQNQDLASRFKREAETVSRLTHLNTVSVFDFGTYQGMMYLVMEYIDGQDLSDLLRIKGPLEFTRAAAILIQVCSALIEAHGKGIVHRDLKPENLLVCRQDERDDFVKVLDFGLAKLRDMHRTRITQKGSLVGTPYYMAPEHIRSETVDQRSDIYALGAVMYKLITGETPFKANTPMGVITKHLTEMPQPPSEFFKRLKIPPIADRVILKAMAKEPEERFQSADEMRAALADAVEGETPGSEYRRFSSSEPSSSWHMGESRTPRPTGWDAARMSAAKNVKTGPTKTGRERISNARSIIIGTREVAISTRSDFIEYEKRLKRKRISVVTISSGVGALIVALLVYVLVASSRDTSSPTLETEPNDTPGEADPLTNGIQLSGLIAGNKPNGDIDWYRIRGEAQGRWAVGISVTSVPGLDIALQLVNPSGSESLATANSYGQGDGETIPPTVVSQPDVYLMVQEVRAPGVPPGNFSQAPYKVLYQMYDPSGIELEPNNGISTATPLKLGVTLRGALDSNDRVDWFSMAAGVTVKTVQVSSSPGADIAMVLRLGPQGKEIKVDNLGPGKGEGVQIPEGPGPIRIAVKLKSITPANASCSYQILIQ